jgi:hypothetical protein
VNTEQGVRGRGRKRDVEEWISGERDRALVSLGNSVGCKFDCSD